MAELKVGRKAPSFTLKDTNDQKVTLKDDVRGHWAVLYFYPKDMTPGCTKQACSFRDNWATLKKRKVKVYGFNIKPIPEGWVTDGEGRPMTDANAAYDLLIESDTGGLTPVGGKPELSSHKGYGLGMMAHILGGVLSGGSFTPIHKPKEGPNGPENIGHFFMAMAPDFFRDEGQFESDLDDVIDFLHDTPPVDPDKPVLVAGDPEAATREDRLQNGVPIPDMLDEQLRDVCRNANVPYVLDRD